MTITPLEARLGARSGTHLSHTPPRNLWGIRILPAAAGHAARLGADEADVVAAINDPDHSQPGFNLCIWHVRADLAVLVSPDGTVMSVRRPDHLPGPQGVFGAGRSLTPSGQQRWTPPNEPSRMAELLRSHGFTIERNGSGHYRVTHAQHPTVSNVMPATPSDHRWAHNFVSEIRHSFGIELRP